MECIMIYDEKNVFSLKKCFLILIYLRSVASLHLQTHLFVHLSIVSFIVLYSYIQINDQKVFTTCSSFLKFHVTSRSPVTLSDFHLQTYFLIYPFAWYWTSIFAFLSQTQHSDSHKIADFTRPHNLIYI